jgi:molybdopterin synthase catalytic subunit
MHVVVRFFAILKERAGVSETSLELPPGSSIAAAVDTLAERFPAIRSDLPRAALAVNRSYAKPDTTLSDGDELALIPPVSGG